MLKEIASCLTAIAVASVASAGADFSNAIAKPSNLGATQVFGPVSGNDKPTAAINLLNDQAFGGTDVFNLNLEWDFAGSSDSANGGPFTGNVETNTGTLTFDNPMTGAFAITLKSANFFSLYYFDASFAGTTSIDFNTIGVSEKNGKGRGLSHASLFTPKDTPPTGIPSPSAAIAGLALLGVIAGRRRRRD